MKKEQVLNADFLEARANLLELAAFIDRLERASGPDDHRSASLRACIPVLKDPEPEKARRILECLSDPTETPLEKAPGKGASGAWPDFPGK